MGFEDGVVNVCKDGEDLEEKGVPEKLVVGKDGGGGGGSGDVVDVSVGLEANDLVPVKEYGVNESEDELKKERKVREQKSIRKSSNVASRIQRGSLSHSLSFPAKKDLGDGMVKSVDGGKQVKKPDGKNARVGGKDGEGSVFSNLSRPVRRASVPGKPGLVNESVNSLAPKVSKLHLEKSKPIRRSLPVPIKDDEDTRSTTSSTTTRAAGFSSRLEDRAEKRREFFAMIEEKTHAKEMEKSNLQEKSKESQEAAIKQLRKSLTFKATPMPTFYKEPPQKVDLKKVPTTRPISPKLGRHKPSVVVIDNCPDGGESCQPSLAIDLKTSTKGVKNNGDSVTLKKPIKRSLSKLPSLKSVNGKTEAKSINSKAKARDLQLENVTVQKEVAENVEELTENHSFDETDPRIKLAADNVHALENEDRNLDIPFPEITVNDSVCS